MVSCVTVTAAASGLLIVIVSTLVAPSAMLAGEKPRARPGIVAQQAGLAEIVAAAAKSHRHAVRLEHRFRVLTGNDISHLRDSPHASAAHMVTTSGADR